MKCFLFLILSPLIGGLIFQAINANHKSMLENKSFELIMALPATQQKEISIRKKLFYYGLLITVIIYLIKKIRKSNSGTRNSRSTTGWLDSRYDQHYDDLVLYSTYRYQKYEYLDDLHVTKRPAATSKITPFQQVEKVRYSKHSIPEKIQVQKWTQCKQGFSKKVIPNQQFLQRCLFEIKCEKFFFQSSYYTTQILKSSEEYQMLSEMFNSSQNKLKIRKIEKILNPYLLIQYEMKKHEYKKKYGQVTEHFLFHGTKKCNLPLICETNLDWRLCGRAVGHKFGKGVCFARQASYANYYGDKYVKRTMILTKVLVGSHCVGNNQLLVPPSHFDTTTNSTLQVFVKYDDNSFYPQYIIHYDDYMMQRRSH